MSSGLHALMIIYLDKKVCKGMNERCAFLRERKKEKKGTRRRSQRRTYETTV